MAEDLRNTVERQSQYIAGGTMSLNRAINPSKLFVRAKGAYLYDVDGKEYIDYHAGFAPYLFGHGDPEVDEAVIEAIRSGASLIGAGTMPWEAEILGSSSCSSPAPARKRWDMRCVSPAPTPAAMSWW